MQIQTTTPAIPFDATARPGGIAMRIWEALVALLRYDQKRQQALRDYDDLLSLPDHMLRDIGIRRDDVRAARFRAEMGDLSDPGA